MDLGFTEQKRSTALKRPHSSEENEKIIKKRRLKSPPTTNIELEAVEAPLIDAPFVLGINDIPQEILGHTIFSYFDFVYWLKNLVPICKHWQLAAVRSNVDKQIWLAGLHTSSNLLGLYTILSKYKVSTLVLRSTNHSIYNLSALINASTALSTLVLHETQLDPIQYTNNTIVRHERITTLVIKLTEIRLIQLFPNVKRLTLLSGQLPDDLDLNLPDFNSLSVKELEIVIDNIPKNVESLSWTKTMFPELTTLYVNQCSTFNDLDSAEKCWKILEEYGKVLKITIHCRFPHQHRRIFNLRGISYAHFFNSRGQTPIEELYKDKHDILQPFLEKHRYITFDYQQSFQQRARQFVFPTLVYHLPWKCTKNTASNNVVNILKNFGLMKENNEDEIVLELIHDPQADIQQIKELCMQLPKECFDRIGSDDIAELVRKARTFQDLVDLLGEDRLLQPQNHIATSAVKKHNYRVWLETIQRGVEISFDGLNFRHEKHGLFQFFMNGYDVIKDVILEDFAANFLFWYLPDMTEKQLREFLTVVKIDLNEVYNKHGQSVLTFLIESSHDFTEMVEFILNEYLLDLNKPDQNDNTPLISALMQHSITFVDMLLEAGANPNVAGNTILPLNYCLALSNQYFVSHAMFSLLLNGADVNGSDADARGRKIYPLKTAVGCGAPLEVIEVLVSFGARVDVVDDAGNTLLHSVFPNKGDVNTLGIDVTNVVKTIRYLSKRVDINARNMIGQTALHRALINFRADLEIKTLIECGADVNVSEPMMNMAPLLMALDAPWFDNPKVLATLLSNGQINIQHKNNANQSFVHYLLQMSPANLAMVFSDSKNRDESNEASHDTKINDISVLRDACRPYTTPDNLAFMKGEIEEYFNKGNKTDFSRELSLFTVNMQLTAFLIETLGFDVNFTDQHNNSLLLMAQTSIYANDQVVDYLLSKGAIRTGSIVANEKLQQSLQDPAKYRLTCQVLKERQTLLKLGASKGTGEVRSIMKKLKRNKLSPDFIDDLIENIPVADLIQLRENKRNSPIRISRVFMFHPPKVTNIQFERFASHKS